MDEGYLQRVKNTLVTILKARDFPNEIALLGLAIRWEPDSVENNNSYDDDRLWNLNIYLPAEAYALEDDRRLSESAGVIRSTLNEITRPYLDQFVAVNFYPELVDKLTFNQEQLIEWLGERLPATHHFDGQQVAI